MVTILETLQAVANTLTEYAHIVESSEVTTEELHDSLTQVKDLLTDPDFTKSV